MLSGIYVVVVVGKTFIHIVSAKKEFSLQIEMRSLFVRIK